MRESKNSKARNMFDVRQEEDEFNSSEMDYEYEDTFAAQDEGDEFFIMNSRDQNSSGNEQNDGSEEVIATFDVPVLIEIMKGKKLILT